MSMLAFVLGLVCLVVLAGVFSPSPPTFFDKLAQLDATLASHGFPRLSPFWAYELRAFFASLCRRLVVRVGRRGGKSTTACKVAVAWALFGDWSVPPGDIGVIAFLSVDRTEAASRLRTIAAMLDALAVKYTRRVDEIELTDRPVLFRVVSATVTGVVGFTAILIIGDEVARWRDVETGANPAREVIASLAPTMATQPNARMFLFSSPWGTNDFHAESVARGNDAHQRVAIAPTWEANPSITEDETRALEPDPRIWAREFLAQPSDAVSSICSAGEYDECVQRGVTRRPAPPGGRFVILTDPALRNDYWVTMVAGRELRDRGAGEVDDHVIIYALSILKPGFFKKLTLADGIGEIAAMHREYPGAVYSDSHYADAIGPELQKREIKFVELKNTPAAMSARIASLQVRLASTRIALLDDEEQRREVLGAQLVVQAGGRMTLRAPERKGRHDDVVSTLLLACDEVTVAKLPFNDGDIVVRSEVAWHADTRELESDTRYYTRDARGKLVPREPPYGTAAFADWAERMLASGHTTVSIQRWLGEHPEFDPQRKGA
jgi:hypothetical protein